MTNNFKLLRCILFSRPAGQWDHSDGYSNDFGLLSQLPLISNRQSWIAFHLEPSFFFIICWNCVKLSVFMWHNLKSTHGVLFPKMAGPSYKMCWSTPDGIPNLVFDWPRQPSVAVSQTAHGTIPLWNVEDALGHKCVQLAVVSRELLSPMQMLLG